ncbi:unnamed protein product [Mytilus edulis]|uniref:Uncharacterized protein n=1 Tax=Mytilus edulis TaxID=6550 RepID=A0A8S3U7T2_MYTED|nr:unnamed protein product [Mytilus edulis]
MKVKIREHHEVSKNKKHNNHRRIIHSCSNTCQIQPPYFCQFCKQFKIEKSTSGHINSCSKIDNILLFTDWRYNRLIICNSDGTEIHHIPLSYQPCYITVVNINSVAVSCFNDRIILIINISARSVTSTINTSGHCYGISYNDNNLYVVIGRSIIHVMDLTGKVIRTIPLPSDNIRDITVDRDRLVCIDRTSIYCCSLDGKLMWKFEKETFQELVRVTSDDKGNVYVIDYFSNTLVVVSDDGKLEKEILTKSDGLNGPFGIYFDNKENILLVYNMHNPLNGPSVVVRVDPAPGFRPLCDDSYLKQLNISIEIGRVKNRNKNPVADKAIAELEDELLREEHDHSPLSENTLVIATTRLNSRLRQRGLSSRELWTQRSQFTHEQLPISDMNLIRAQHEARNKNHGFSENSKCSRPGRPTPDINIGDLVYLYTDRSKTQSRDRYLVVARDGEWCFIKKFSGNQLRASSYKVKLSECYKVLNTISAQQNPRYSQNVYNEESDSDGHDEDSLPGPIRDLPPDRAEPPPILICENIDDVENLDEPTAQHDNSLEHDLTLSNSSTEQDNKRAFSVSAPN